MHLPGEGVAPRQASMRKLENGAPPEQQRAGRVCEAPGCKARLSRYNPARRCATHAGWTDPDDTRQRR